MVDDADLQRFGKGLLYHSKSITRPWNSKLTDEALLGIYKKAIEANANVDFIKLLLDEIIRRKLRFFDNINYPRTTS
jgi:hypothetical protein